jgi:SSS family solute:Na+ symporter
VVGLLTGFILSVFFNEFAPAVLGNETLIYTAYPNGSGGFEIPFLICMGLAFAFAVVAMIAVSLVGPKINPNAFILDKEMFRPDARTTALVVVTILLLSAIYVRFW